jgi:hypothetical protein
MSLDGFIADPHDSVAVLLPDLVDQLKGVSALRRNLVNPASVTICLIAKAELSYRLTNWLGTTYFARPRGR